MKRGLLCTLQSLKVEAGVSQEEDSTVIKDLKYWEVDCELWVSTHRILMGRVSKEAFKLRGTIVVG